LSFNEVFDLDKPKEERGFDVVMGNPPYVSAWEMEESDILSRRILPKIYSDNFQLKSHWDLYIPFILQATNIARNDGYFSYILPNPICREKYAVEIRRYILENSTIKQLLAAETYL
jgi:type I restriction-modification system DNA methylase subunit